MADKDEVAGEREKQADDRTTRQLDERGEGDAGRAAEGPGKPTDLVGKPVAHEPWDLPGEGEPARGKPAPPEERRKQPR